MSAPALDLGQSTSAEYHLSVTACDAVCDAPHDAVRDATSHTTLDACHLACASPPSMPRHALIYLPGGALPMLPMLCIAGWSAMQSHFSSYCLLTRYLLRYLSLRCFARPSLGPRRAAPTSQVTVSPYQIQLYCDFTISF